MSLTRSRRAKIAAGLLTGGLLAGLAMAVPTGASRAARPQDPPPKSEPKRVDPSPPPDAGKAGSIPDPGQEPAATPPPSEAVLGAQPPQVPSLPQDTSPREPAPKPDPAPAPVASPAALSPDPEKDAEEFVTRTRKEALDRIAALDREAAELRARLAKVEAASARLKTAFGGFEPVLRPGAVRRDLSAPTTIYSEGPQNLKAPEPEPNLQPVPQPKSQ